MSLSDKKRAEPEATYREVAELLAEHEEDETDYDQLSRYLQSKGFSDHKAKYVTDEVGADRIADLKHVSLYDISKQLGDLNQWEYELLKSVRNGVRKHYGMLTLLQESQANQEAVRMELAAREAHYLAHSSAAGSSSTAGSSSAADSSSASKQYLVAYASLSEIARFLKERGFTEKNVELITRELNITEVWQLSNVSESVLDKVCKKLTLGYQKKLQNVIRWARTEFKGSPPEHAARRTAYVAHSSTADSSSAADSSSTAGSLSAAGSSSTAGSSSASKQNLVAYTPLQNLPPAALALTRGHTRPNGALRLPPAARALTRGHTG
jgi:hypothetical protein